MKNIDFLPEYYRQRNELRRARLWWGLCASLFGLVILATSASQWWMRRSVNQQLQMVQPLHAASTNQDLRFTQLQAKVNQAAEEANLFVYLKHPWPRSQILAALAEKLPPTVTLASVQLQPQATREAGELGGTRKQRKAETEKDDGKTPAQKDLHAIRKQQDESQTIVQVLGFANDQAELHQYISQLGESPLFKSAELKSIEVGVEGDPSKASRARFEARLHVRPRYGQPDGPNLKTPPKPKVMTEEVRATPPRGGVS